jgi:hypothetical protein
MTRFFRLPSPAMAVAFLALFLVLGGSAMALRGRNTVDSGDIRNNTVRGKDVRNATLTGRDIRNGSVRGGDVAESSLSQVPSAASADRAGTAATATRAGSATTATSAMSATTAGNAATVGGRSVKKFHLSLPGGTGQLEEPVFGGVELQVTCAASMPNLDARNESGQNANASAQGIDDPNGPFANSNVVASGGTLDLTTSPVESGGGTATFFFSGGRVTTIEYGYSTLPLTVGHGCEYWGVITTG